MRTAIILTLALVCTGCGSRIDKLEREFSRLKEEAMASTTSDAKESYEAIEGFVEELLDEEETPEDLLAKARELQVRRIGELARVAAAEFKFPIAWEAFRKLGKLDPENPEAKEFLESFDPTSDDPSNWR